MKILLVDDERMIKEWLEYTISSLPFHISLIDSASNGLEALEKLSQENYDLIFVDMTMPKMNGIEFLKKINQDAIDAMLIVLSSHDDFQFAREALKYNIREYILKNECSREKLSEILYSCQEKISNKQIDSTMTQEFMERVIKDNIPEKGIDIIKKNFARLSGKLFFIAAVKMEKKEIKPGYTSQFFKLKYEGMIGSIEELSFYAFSIEAMGNQHTYNFEYSSYLYEVLGSQVSCGKICRDVDEILSQCRNCWIGFQSLFYSGESHCSGMHRFRKYETAEIDSLCEKTISRIRSFSREQTLQHLREINEYFHTATPTDVESLMNIYLLLLNSYFIYNYAKSKEVINKLNIIRASISGFETFSELSEWALKAIDDKNDLINSNKYSTPVKEAIGFIESNYDKIISVPDIAEYVNMSHDYFSRLFKKEVGETLNSFLINYRLDKASIIILSSDLSIQEVARKVGIENGGYFSKCFKKKFQMQPIQFRIQAKNV
ncbi:response regulator [Spirochaeta isovalerica]|uniref:YesN/AraC family two-component response regulator n=1 Tax=Spirochaeta isovalerica TaxID=150 RepID=A0A841RB31_9SPIO|nr:response regulator [Spirochaeta isovalerica]MBB6481165.1 YesN/AraC family two-component response regulator [Spirochaeta isovalerica]